MAKVSLRHLKKVFPNEEKKRSKNDQERRNNLQVTAEGRDVIAIVPTAGGRVGYTPGQTVHLTFDGGVAHVFDPETEKNLEW